jgi:hypothetical protein
MPARLLDQRLAFAVTLGAVIVFALVVGVVGLRPDLRIAAAQSDFWIKLIYTSVIALMTLAGARRLARPEVSDIKLSQFAVPVAVLMVLAIFELGAAPSAERATLVFGTSWRECPILIASLSLPMLAILFVLFRGFAPQRPGLTGGAIGLAAGAITAMLYSLHCPETAMTFLLIWYTAGIAIVAALGALIGPRALRW